MSGLRKLHILDVGHGNSAVLVDDGGTVIFDAGPNNTLLEFLLQENIRHVKNVLISHADLDHIKGLIALIASEFVTIERVYLNSDSQKASDIWDDLLFTLDRTHKATGGIRCLTSLHVGMDDLSCGRVRIEVLSPSFYWAGLGPGATDRFGTKLTSNTLSAVFRLSQEDDVIALFPGDIDTPALKYLVESGQDMHARVAVFPHHGGRPGRNADPVAFAQDFTVAVRPEVMLFSISRGGATSNPRKDVIGAVRSVLPDVKIACTQLSEHCDVRKRFSMSHLTKSFAKGREQQISCAGSLFIDLDNRPEVLQALDAHYDFVTGSVSSPLCVRLATLIIPTIEIISTV